MKNISKYITKDFSIKLLCLCAAAILWLYVASTESATTKLPGSVKINSVNVPIGLTAIYDNQFVDLQISTDPATLHKLSPASFSAYIDLSSYKEGTIDVPIIVTTSVPNVKIISKKPDSVLVTLEATSSKEVKIGRKINGNLADGYVINAVDFKPDKVTLVGAKSILEGITEATALIKLDGETQSFNKTVPLFVYDKDGESIDGVKSQPGEVEASVAIAKGSNIKTIGIKPIVIGNPKANYFVSNVSVKPNTADITGISDSLSDIKFIETEAIDITALSSNFTKEVNLSLPEGVTVAAGSTLKVSVSIEFSGAEVTKQIQLNNIKIDLPPSFSLVSINPSQITVTCLGLSDNIASLGAGNISAHLDLTAKSLLTNADNFVDLKADNFIIPIGIVLKDFTPKTLTIRVK